MANGRTRREPAFDTRADAGALNLRLTREDRAGGHMAKAARRATTRDGGDERPPRRGTPKGSGRSLLGRFVYFGLVLGLWGLIGIAGIVAYHASQLPPTDQLTVPKRPPNI